jgi:hypothetical protein
MRGAEDGERPTWFTGPAEGLAILNEASVRCGVQLDPSTPPSEDEAWELADALTSILVATGFDGEYRPTPRGQLIESLIDALAVYYDTDDE